MSSNNPLFKSLCDFMHLDHEIVRNMVKDAYLNPDKLYFLYRKTGVTYAVMSSDTIDICVSLPLASVLDTPKIQRDLKVWGSVPKQNSIRGVTIARAILHTMLNDEDYVEYILSVIFPARKKRGGNVMFVNILSHDEPGPGCGDIRFAHPTQAQLLEMYSWEMGERLKEKGPSLVSRESNHAGIHPIVRKRAEVGLDQYFDRLFVEWFRGLDKAMKDQPSHFPVMIGDHGTYRSNGFTYGMMKPDPTTDIKIKMTFGMDPGNSPTRHEFRPVDTDDRRFFRQAISVPLPNDHTVHGDCVIGENGEGKKSAFVYAHHPRLDTKQRPHWMTDVLVRNIKKAFHSLQRHNNQFGIVVSYPTKLGRITQFETMSINQIAHAQNGSNTNMDIVGCALCNALVTDQSNDLSTFIQYTGSLDDDHRKIKAIQTIRRAALFCLEAFRHSKDLPSPRMRVIAKGLAESKNKPAVDMMGVWVIVVLKNGGVLFTRFVKE